MKRRAPQLLAGALVLALAWAAMWCVLLYAHHGSLGVWCGMLTTAQEQYLDGSNRIFQRGSFHLGIGTRTWAETYGLKMRRLYVTVAVVHINPKVTPEEANE